MVEYFLNFEDLISVFLFSPLMFVIFYIFEATVCFLLIKRGETMYIFQRAQQKKKGELDEADDSEEEQVFTENSQLI